MLSLSNVTSININCVDPEDGVRALLHSQKEIQFNKSILFSHMRPYNLTDDIEFVEIPKLSHDGFSKFCIEQLNDYINTDYVLSINTDGFVINPHLWTDEFLEYDYIGAPWAPNMEWCKRNRVGNGGFCLKSKKFLELSSRLTYVSGHDDVYVTNTKYDYFIENGVKYAPVQVAMKFSLESKIPECEYNLNNSFGFHGKGDSWVFQNEGQQFKDRISILKNYN